MGSGDRAWRLALATSGDAKARLRGKIALARALVRAAAAEGCDRLQAAASLRFLETVTALPSKLEEAYERERNHMMTMADLDILTYGEKKAFREAERRSSAQRMRALGLDLDAIGRYLGVSRKAVAELLAEPASVEELE